MLTGGSSSGRNSAGSTDNEDGLEHKKPPGSPGGSSGNYAEGSSSAETTPRSHNLETTTIARTRSLGDQGSSSSDEAYVGSGGIITHKKKGTSRNRSLSLENPKISSPEENHENERVYGIEGLEKKRKPTIGIVGISRKDVAKFYETFVDVSNKNGLKDDQDHPEAVAVATGASTLSSENRILEVKRQIEICCDFGCDIITVSSGKTYENSEIVKYIEEKGKIAVYRNEESVEKLATNTLKSLASVVEISRPDISCYEIHDKDLSEELKNNLRQDRKERKERISKSKENGTYNFKEKTIGVLGGAGPRAGANLLVSLANADKAVILNSANVAPGKLRNDQGKGPTYIEHYKGAIEFFTEIGTDLIAIPCNTAHKRLEQYCSKDHLDKVVDFRRSVIKRLVELEKKEVILLGTNTTTGVGNEEDGIYEEFRKNVKGGDQIKFITGSLSQQDEINKAIYLVKDGEIAKAGIIIECVISQIRIENLLENGELEDETKSKLKTIALKAILISSQIKKSKSIKAKDPIDIPSLESEARKLTSDLKDICTSCKVKTLDAILACTELPIPFGGSQSTIFSEMNYFDPAIAVVRSIGEIVTKSSYTSHDSHTSSSSNISSAKSESGGSEHSATSRNIDKKSILDNFEIKAWKKDTENKIIYRIVVQKKDGCTLDLRNCTNQLLKLLSTGRGTVESFCGMSKAKNDGKSRKISCHVYNQEREGSWIRNIKKSLEEYGVAIATGAPPKDLNITNLEKTVLDRTPHNSPKSPRSLTTNTITQVTLV